MEAFDQVLDGGVYVSPELELNRVFGATGKPEPDDPLETLSMREDRCSAFLWKVSEQRRL